MYDAPFRLDAGWTRADVACMPPEQAADDARAGGCFRHLAREYGNNGAQHSFVCVGLPPRTRLRPRDAHRQDRSHHREHQAGYAARCDHPAVTAASRGAASRTGMASNRIVKVLPTPGALTTLSVPSCAATMARLMYRPSPLPSVSRV